MVIRLVRTLEEYSFAELADMHLVYITFDEHWIGRGGPIAWPPRSPDLTLFNSWVCGHLKSPVYTTPIVSEQDLVARILVANDQLQHKYGESQL